MPNRLTRYATLFAALVATGHAAAAPLEEVIVTAQKREQNLQDVPMAVSAIGGEALAAAGIDNIQDLTKLVPSLKFTAADNPRNTSIRVRGVGTSVFSVSVEPNVSVVLDGVPLARTSQANFEFADIGRVEVLRGPQGTLFGKNASAGLVHVITRKPGEELEGDVRVTYQAQEHGPGDTTKSQFTFSGPVTENSGARLTGFWRTTTGHIIDVNNDNEKLAGGESGGLRAKYQWDLSDLLSLQVNAEYQAADGTPHPFVYRDAGPEVRQSEAPAEPGEDNNKATTQGNTKSEIVNKAISLNVDWEIGDLTLTSITGLRKTTSDEDLSSGPLSGEGTTLEFNGGDREIRTFTQEVRLTSPGGEKLDWSVGTLWFENYLENTFQRLLTDIEPAIALNNPVLFLLPAGPGNLDAGEFLNTAVKTENLGIFGQATWHMTDKLNLTFGARYIHEELESRFVRRNFAVESQSGAPVTSSEASQPWTRVRDDAFSGTLSLQYDWGEHSVAYTTLARGYRGRAFDVSSSSQAGALDNPIEPETSTSFEVGLKSRLFDDRLEINTSVFYTVFKNFQAQLLRLSDSGAVESKLANAGELETKGVEIDFKAAIVDNLSLSGGLLYNRAVYNEFITQCYPSQGTADGGIDTDNDGDCDLNDVAGSPLDNAPEWSGSLTVRYDYPLNTAGHIVYGQLSGRYQSEVVFSNTQHPNTVHDGYSVYDLHVG